jgi:RND family efflux transporter MFP subunit
MSTSKTEKTKAKGTRPRKKNRWLGTVIVFAVTAGILAAGIMMALYLNRETAEVVPARRGKAISAVYGTVKIEWAWSQSVKSENEGYIQLASGIYSGQSSIGILVKKGQILGTILDDATSRQIQQAKTDLQAAQDRQRIGPLGTQTLRTAEDNLQRLMQLKSLNNVPEAQLEKAKNDVTQLKDAVKAEQVEINRMVENLAQNLDNLLDKMKKTEIKSPMDGVLTGINCTDGERVFLNNALFTIAQNSTYINGQVNEEDVGGLKPGMNATIRLYSFANQEFAAKLSSIVPGGDATTQRYTTILYFDEGSMPPNLMAGMTGEMNIILGERENSILIPASALLVDKVYIVKDNVVVPRDVQVGFRSMEKVEILSGIDEGDMVIKADQDKFRPGEKIHPIQVSTLKKL